MSKHTNEKLVSNIASADAKIAKVQAAVKAAEEKARQSVKDIAEIEATRGYYVGLLAARGLDETGQPLEKSDDETQVAGGIEAIDEPDEVAPPEFA